MKTRFVALVAFLVAGAEASAQCRVIEQPPAIFATVLDVDGRLYFLQSPSPPIFFQPSTPVYSSYYSPPAWSPPAWSSRGERNIRADVRVLSPNFSFSRGRNRNVASAST
jgi:hypothetical protein